MAFAAPGARDDAAYEKRFEGIKFNSDEAGSEDAFHTFKSRYELSLKASRTQLVASAKPPPAAAGAAAADRDAATYQRDKWEHYQLLFHNALSSSVTGSQLSTVIIPAADGHRAWEGLCNKNESKHTITAVSLIYRLISVIKWESNQNPDPRWAVSELTKTAQRLSELTYPINVDERHHHFLRHCLMRFDFGNLLSALDFLNLFMSILGSFAFAIVVL